MENSLRNIKSIIDNVLGASKRDYCGSGGWFEYNCPHCADINNGPDNKYNFAINIEQFYGHCWKCGYRGKLSKVIKKYGSNIDIEEYREELSILKESKLYTFNNPILDSLDDSLNDSDLELPQGFKLIKKDDYYCQEAYKYLINRGLNDTIIENYRIGYIGKYQGKFSNRIVIPSYDSFGDLNYWIARDYTGTSYFKILNAEVDKKKITFNESYINWYEPITLVEGPFDHIIVPNSIPLLGKVLTKDCDIYNKLIEKSQSYINIFLDDDALSDAYKIYKLLNTELPGKIKIIKCPDGYDASDYYKLFGNKGILSLLKTAHHLDEYSLSFNSF